jgi:hypothetical protein
MFHKDAPDYLNSLVPPQISETHQHNLFRHRVTVWTLIWWHLLLCGPPQVEDFLRIALFLIYINDIVNNISCNVKLFADDTSLYLVVDNEYEAANKLNKDVICKLFADETFLV